MRGYARPEVPQPEFRDAQGRVIDYGTRWGGESPPENTYSTCTHPERFAPLHAVADALITHLSTAYRVRVTDDPACAADLERPPPEVVRAVRLTPDSATAASLTFVFTPFPSLVVRAGLLHDFPYPSCGCDACDEEWHSQAGELEAQVGAVVAGHYREFLLDGDGPNVGYSVMGPDGGLSRGGTTTVGRDQEERVRAARSRLSELPDGWTPWPAV